MVDFIRSAATEKLVRSLRIEPFDVDVELSLHLVNVHGQEESAGEFVLEAAVEPFDDGDTAVFADGTVAVLDMRKAPVFEFVAVELPATVCDDVPGGTAHGCDQFGEHGAGLLGRRLLFEGRELVDSTRVVIFDGHDPVAEGEALRQGEGQPGHAESSDERNQGKVDAPDVVGPVGFNGLRFRLIFGGGLDLRCGFRSGHRFFLEDIPGCGHRHGKSCPSQCGDDLLCAQTGVERLESLDQIADVVRELIHRLCGPEQRVGTVFIAAVGPSSDSAFRDQQVSGGLRGVPPTSGHEFKSLEPLHRGVLRSFCSGHPSEAGQQKPQLLVLSVDLPVTQLKLGVEPDPGQRAVASHSAGAGNRRVGQGNGLQNCGLDVGVPGFGQWDVFEGANVGHEVVLEQVDSYGKKSGFSSWIESAPALN